MTRSDHSQVSFTFVDFRHYKGFENLSLNLHRTNILVGPNNCGKSTIIGAFRLLEVALRRARTKNPELVHGPNGETFGYRIAGQQLPISLENVHTNYAEVDSTITFRLSNGTRLLLYFPRGTEGCLLIPTADRGIRSTSSFRTSFPLDIALVPVLGPLEHDEPIVTVDTVEKDRGSHRASRHFRNYWYHFPQGFDEFAALIERTWPGMKIARPAKVDVFSRSLHMFCEEDRITRELYWSGFGFQVWCQMLTNVSRAEGATIFIVDEPEIYLHPDVQRQLLGILRDIGPDILIATHSTEIMSEADPSEIVVIEKTRRHAQRLRDIVGVQAALEKVGSVQNITLTRLARNRRILFVEDDYDFGVIRQFARRLGLIQLASGNEITPVALGGFSFWERVAAMGWGLEKTLGSAMLLAAIFDRDYLCEEEVAKIVDKLKESITTAFVHARKEIENYLLVPIALQRAMEDAIRERRARTGEVVGDIETVETLLSEVTSTMKVEALGQYVQCRVKFLQSPKRHPATITSETITWFEDKWKNIDSRMEIVPGKKTLSALRSAVQERYSIGLTDGRIINSMREDEFPSDLADMLRALDEFRKARVPSAAA
jgi:energy-coupling factor transporter ATP-binding protein EcfA2